MDAYWIEGTASGLPGFWSDYAEGDNMGINTGGGWMGDGEDKEERDAHNERMAADLEE